MKLKVINALLMSILFAALLTGCSSFGERTQPLETDWGRGLVLGAANLREPATLALAEQGQVMHFAWAQKGEYGIDIHYARVDRQDGIQVSEQLQAGLFLPRSFQLFLTSQGEIHLLSLAKSNKDGVSGVYHVQISEDGELLGSPELITPPEQSVENYDAAMLPNGQVALVWESARETGSGLYHRSLNWEDDTSSYGVVGQLNPTGRSPSVAAEQTNALHLTWHIDDYERGLRDVYYAEFTNADLGASDGDLITSIPLNDSTDLSPPVVGFDDGHVYVFWHSDVVGGLEAGTGKTDFVSFPKGHPDQVVKREILIPDSEGGATVSPLNQLTYSPVSPEMFIRSSSYVIYPAPVSADAPELPLLLSARTTFRLQEEMQPVMAVLVDGVQVGYSPVARTNNITFFPTGTRDAHGQAYAVWIDYRGGGRYPVISLIDQPGLEEWRSANDCTRRFL